MNEQERVRRDWRIPDELWARIEALLPARKPHPLGCHRPRVKDRASMDAIFLSAAYRMPVERTLRHRDLLLLLGAPAPPGVE